MMSRSRSQGTEVTIVTGAFICNHSFPKTNIFILIFILQAMSVFGV